MNEGIERMRAQVREYDIRECGQAEQTLKDPRQIIGNRVLCSESAPKEPREISHRMDILRDRQDRLVTSLQRLTVSLEPVLRPGEPDCAEKALPQPPDETQLGGALANCIVTTDRSIAMVDSIASCLQL